MSDDITIALEERTILGKGLNGLRGQGLVPAVVHDHGKDSIHVMGDSSLLSKAYQRAGKHHPVQLSVGKKDYLALIKDVDFEPVKQRMRHVVFQAIKQNEAVEAEIPIVMEGEVPAERASLMVITSLDAVLVEALPKNLPDELKVDASVLAEVGDKITVADLVVPDGVTIMTDPETAIAVVEMPRDQIAEADAAAASLAEDAGVPDEAETPIEEPAESTEAQEPAEPKDE